MEHPKRKGWYPDKPLEGKSNWKRIYTIDRDGSVVDNVFLNISDARLREDVIAIHFLNSNSTIILPDDDIDLMTGRDAPWDFCFALRSGGTLNLEIVAISDNAHKFETHRREELADRVFQETTIPLSLLRRIDKGIPTSAAREIIQEAERRSAKPSDQVANPWHNPTKEIRHIYVSSLGPPDGSLGQLVETAVRAKELKRHADKESTVLIVDNRTQGFDVDDYHAMISDPGWDLSKTPFKQIWFYTGYYSNLDGSNAEYAWSVLHADEEVLRRLKRSLREELIDDLGVVRRSV